MKLKIITLTVDSAPVLAHLHQRAFVRPWSLRQIEEGLASAGAFAFGFEVDGLLAGFVLARAAADEAEILTLAVLPEYRRRSGAKSLMQRAMTEAKLNGALEMFLEVAADNAPAQALYAALGFAKSGKRPAYYGSLGGHPIDALVMRRRLA